MFTPPTYLGFLLVALGPPIVLLALLTWGRVRRPFLTGSVLVTAIGLAYTIPWDNALIAREVWWYGEEVVLGHIYLAPVEEYLFILLQPVLTALWVAVLRGRAEAAASPLTRASADPADHWSSVPWRTRAVGGIAGLLVGATGLLMLTAASTFYLGAILAWAGPVLAVQWAFGWPYLWRVRRLVAPAILVPTLYLAAADRIAIELGLWTISPASSTGLFVAGLPVEEGAFFLLTNAFVVQGLLLYCWVLDRPTPTDSPTTIPVTQQP